jgi:chemotaxis protein histidine kinase CheA
MTKKHPIEIFMPPNILKAKIGGTFSRIDATVVKRAEKAMADLKTEFGEWISADIAALGEAYEQFKSAPESEDSRDILYRASHDLRGQARTFEFPLVGHVATSLCKLLDGYHSAGAMTLIDAHVSAIRVIVRQNLKDPNDKMAGVLIAELQARVNEFLNQNETA